MSRRRITRLVSLFLVICMVVLMAPTIAFASSVDPSVRIEVKNAQSGNTQYKLPGGNWIDLNESKAYDITNISPGDLITVRAIPNSEQELDTDGTTYSVDGSQKTIDCEALQTQSGWSFTAAEGTSYKVCVEYRGAKDDDNPPISESGRFTFTCQSNAITGGSVYYKLNNSGDFVKVGEGSNKYSPITTLADTDTSITLKFKANDGYKLDTTRGVLLRVDENEAFRSTTGNIADFTSETGYTFDLSSLVASGSSVSASKFELEFGFGSEDGSAGGDDNPPSDAQTEITVDASIDDFRIGHLSVNGVAFVEGANPVKTVNKTMSVDTDGETDEIEIAIDIGHMMSGIKINNVDMSMEGVTNYVVYQVPHSDTYVIEITYGGLDPDTLSVISWDYIGTHFGEDALVEHGKVEPISAKLPDGTVLDASDLKENGLKPNNLHYPHWTYTAECGEVRVPEKTILTLKIIPDYGYQVTSSIVNNDTFLTPDNDNIAQYTFEVKGSTLHFSGLINKVNDTVQLGSDKINSGTVKLGNNETSVTMGTVRLDVDDAAVTPEQKGKFEEAAGDYEVLDYFDISLYQTVYKGSANKVWDTQIKNLDKNATIALKLEDTFDGDNALVIHEKHDGTYEQLPATYDASTNTITFQTSSFSNYAIAASSNEQPVDYEIIKGANQEVYGDKDAAFTSNAEYSKFEKVQVDGKDVDPSYYTVAEGSTIVTLKAEFLKALKNGSHTISIVSEDGAASAGFSKKTKSSSTPDIPETGDDSNIMLSVILMLISGMVLVATIVYDRKAALCKATVNAGIANVRSGISNAYSAVVSTCSEIVNACIEKIRLSK